MKSHTTLFCLTVFSMLAQNTPNYFVPHTNDAATYNQSLSEFQKLDKEKNRAFERVKNSGTPDLENNQFSQQKLMMHRGFYSEFLTKLETEIEFLKSSTVLLKNPEFVIKSTQLNFEFTYYQEAALKTGNFVAYQNPNNNYKIPGREYANENAGYYEKIKADIEKQKVEDLAEIAEFKTSLKLLIQKCSSKTCSHCNGKGTTKQKTGTETNYTTNDVWREQTKTVNTSTGNTNSTYGFNKERVATTKDVYSDIACKQCIGTGKCVSKSCIDYEKNAVLVRNFFPDLCLE